MPDLQAQRTLRPLRADAGRYLDWRDPAPSLAVLRGEYGKCDSEGANTSDMAS